MNAPLDAAATSPMTPVANVQHFDDPDLLRVAVGLSGIAVVGITFGLEISKIYVDDDAAFANISWHAPLSSDKGATVELAGDAVLHILGIAEMDNLEPPLYRPLFSDFDIASDAIREGPWFDDPRESEDGHGWQEMIHLLEACRLRALRILSHPGYKEAVEALAHALLKSEEISGQDAGNLIREVIARVNEESGEA